MYQPIIILASSRKNGGICLAGKRHGMGEWVRPVSVQPGQAWSVRSLHYVAGCVPQVGERFLLLTAVDSRTNPASTAGTAQHDLDLVSG